MKKAEEIRFPPLEKQVTDLRSLYIHEHTFIYLLLVLDCIYHNDVQALRHRCWCHSDIPVEDPSVWKRERIRLRKRLVTVYTAISSLVEDAFSVNIIDHDMCQCPLLVVMDPLSGAAATRISLSSRPESDYGMD